MAIRDKQSIIPYSPKVPFGIYRLDCALVDQRGQIPANGTTTPLTFAYAPAADPHQLPDDWPINAHITFDGPALARIQMVSLFQLDGRKTTRPRATMSGAISTPFLPASKPSAAGC